MRIRYLRVRNFRAIRDGHVVFPDHVAVIGGNSVGKSTLCEALDLLLGPDRLSRPSPIDEHDFPGRRYVEAGEPVPIEIEGILTDFSSDLATRYRTHLEYWDSDEQRLLDETDGPEDAEGERVVPALRVVFRGIYDPEEDEFAAETRFASPPSEDSERRNHVSRADKRRFGFLYLRALRTGTRALSLERGSLLDIILTLKDDERAEMWERTLESLEQLDPPIDDIPQLRGVLDEVDKRVRQFVALTPDERAFALYPSPLTRESLRRSVTLFGASERSQALVPYWRLGSGVINAMVFSLLTFIAELKQNVIFAMEEPELALPPHTQRRIVQFLQNAMDQVIVTTHSPFVLEQFAPESVVLLDRDTDNVLAGKPLELSGIKAKTYRGGLRRHFAEAMLGRGVICVEGVSDTEVLQTASAVLEAEGAGDKPYTPLDLSGVTIVQCEGDGGLTRHGEFFSHLGLRAYAFFDKQKHVAQIDEIEKAFDHAWEIQHAGIEKLLAEEIPEEVLSAFLEEASTWEDYPVGEKFKYDPFADDQDIRKTCFNVLRSRKGAGYPRRLVERCSSNQLPAIIVDALRGISEDLPNRTPSSEAEAQEAEGIVG